MRFRAIVLVGAALVAFAFAAGYTTGQTAEKGPALKSLHLLNLPDGMTEEDLAGVLTKANGAIHGEGHHMAGYRLWKVTGEQVGDYAYMSEGNWPNQEAYDAIHENEAYVAAVEGFDYDAIRPVQVYNRYVEIPTGAACCAKMEHKRQMERKQEMEHKQQMQQEEQDEDEGR
jgi:hypothetical protein